MEHYVRTAYGVAETCYTKDEGQPPPQGILQGNGASGAAWAAVASSLVDMMYEAGYGVEIWTAISNKAIHILSFGFVDDYNLLVASKPDDQYLDDLVELWNEGLRATGGALDPGKSFWWLIDMVWHDGS